MAGTTVRRDVSSLPGPWHPILRAYALAVREMRSRPADDPTSWEYQASVHGMGSVFDPPPDDFRSQCQHNCWYFLPWHRWYLYYFEQTIRSVLTSLTELPSEVADIVDEWALPYWNYAVTAGRRLPPEFASDEDWAGRENPLHDDTRGFGVNERTASVDVLRSRPLPGVLQQPFTSTDVLEPTLAGTRSTWQHFREGGGAKGGLEGTPHDAVHGFVGGNMLDFDTAGLDPVFWLHHCNIDRYWEVRGHADDPTGAWLGVKFNFRDATASTAVVDSDGCVDTVGQLGYRYDDTAPPTPTPGAAVRLRRSAMTDPVPPPDLPAEVVGTRDGVHLQGEPVDAPMQVGPVSEQFRTLREGSAEPQRVYLTINDIRGEVNPGISYAVYVNEPVEEQLAGLISFFGIKGTRDGAHALDYTFDITDIVQALRDDDAWDPEDLHVVFRPVGADYDDDSGPPLTDTPPVDVGSISIAYR